MKQILLLVIMMTSLNSHGKCFLNFTINGKKTPIKINSSSITSVQPYDSEEFIMYKQETSLIKIQDSSYYNVYGSVDTILKKIKACSI